MNLPVLSFNNLVANAGAAAQGACSFLLNLATGSVIRALLEANASAALWMQYIVMKLALTVRASTSTGVDLDLWVNDFGLYRLPGVAATGSATFQRYSTTTQGLVPLGTTVGTSDGTATFTVTLNASNPAWNAGLNGYTLAIGVSTVTVPVQAAAVGITGNVIAGAIALITSSVSGIDTVTNSSPFVNGQAAETDAALRVRFQNFINSRSQATRLALQYAITSTQSGLLYSITENSVYPANTFLPGWVTIAVDDGTGTPSAALVASVATAVNAARPVGVTIYVTGPINTFITVSFNLTAATGYVLAALDIAAAAAVTAYINGLNPGQNVSYLNLAGVIYSSTPGIVGVTNLLLNGGTVDLVAATPFSTYRTTSVTAA